MVAVVVVAVVVVVAIPGVFQALSIPAGTKERMSVRRGAVRTIRVRSKGGSIGDIGCTPRGSCQHRAGPDCFAWQIKQWHLHEHCGKRRRPVLFACLLLRPPRCIPDRLCCALRRVSTYEEDRAVLFGAVEDPEPHCCAEELGAPAVLERGWVRREARHGLVPARRRGSCVSGHLDPSQPPEIQKGQRLSSCVCAFVERGQIEAVAYVAVRCKKSAMVGSKQD